MNGFDFTIVRFLTSFANASPAFDRFANALPNLELVKGGVVMALFWAAWFGRGADERRRGVLITTLAAAGAALFVAMALAMLLPFRARPLLLFQEPDLVPPSWREWSAFPSDHATLFFALATGLLRAVPPLGWVAFGHALVVVCLPRVYLGLHYPTDIVGGAALGVAMTYILTGTAMCRRISAWPLAQMKRRPGSFYAILFLLTYLIATLFGDLRRSGVALYGYLAQ